MRNNNAINYKTFEYFISAALKRRRQDNLKLIYLFKKTHTTLRIIHAYTLLHDSCYMFIYPSVHKTYTVVYAHTRIELYGPGRT